MLRNINKCFLFNYAILKKRSLIDSINYFKLNMFKSEDEKEKLIDIIIYDYFRLFGFLGGSKNNFFNYYDGLNNYPYLYFNDKRFLKMDFTLLKYLLAMTNKHFDIKDYLKFSNIENVYSLFDKIFFSNITSNIKEEKADNDKMIIEDNKNSIDKNEENNCVIQLRFLLELIIIFMKDDSSLYWALMRFYEETISSQTKRELFDFIKNNEHAKKDLENILKEKIILEIIAKENLIDLRKLKKILTNIYLIFLMKMNLIKYLMN